MTRAEAAEVITALDWRDEVSVLAADRIRVAAVDRLGGITPAMIEWWFSRMDEATYFQFHPVNHKAFAWVRGKQPGQHVGATHLTHHCYGATLRCCPPRSASSRPVTCSTRARPRLTGLGAVICAVVHRLDEDGQPEPAEAGRFVHVAVDRGYGTELRSCWWLAIGPDTDLDVVTNRRLRHVHEEFAYLAGFLPGLYAREGGGA